VHRLPVRLTTTLSTTLKPTGTPSRPSTTRAARPSSWSIRPPAAIGTRTQSTLLQPQVATPDFDFLRTVATHSLTTSPVGPASSREVGPTATVSLRTPGLNGFCRVAGSSQPLLQFVVRRRPRRGPSDVSWGAPASQRPKSARFVRSSGRSRSIVRNWTRIAPTRTRLTRRACSRTRPPKRSASESLREGCGTSRQRYAHSRVKSGGLGRRADVRYHT